MGGHCDDHGLKATSDVVDGVYDVLLSPGKKGYFDYWEQRLTEELGPPDDGYAIELLNAVARNPEGETRTNLQGVLSAIITGPDRRDSLLRYLLDVLQSDGYLVEDGGRFRFRSFLLRDFWERRLLS